MNKKTIFISSYPKSGNTWIRILISSLLNKNDGVFDFADLNIIRLFSKHTHFSSFKDIKYDSNNNLDFSFVANNWINAQKIINKKSPKTKIFKTHSVRGVVNGNFFTDSSVCLGFIYIIRDPRDIVVSLSKHMGIDTNKAIDIILNNNKFMTSSHKVNELVCTWKNNLESWLTFTDVPRLVIRYEDIVENLNKILHQLVEFIEKIAKLEIKNKENKIKNVIKSTNFDILKKEENKRGFKEASNFSSFFREGKSGQWLKELTNDQIKLMENKLNKTLKKLNYI